MGLPLAVKDAQAEKAPTRESSVTKRLPALHFMRFGKGPPVVFLHGVGGDSSVFIEEMQRLEPTHTVLLIDLPGHGMSKDPPPHIELPVIAQKIAELIESQHLAPAVLVGHSLGGTLAGYVALADPKAVRGLCIVDSMFAPLPIPQEDRDRMRFQLGRDRTLALREFFGPLAHDPRQLDKIVAGAARVSGQTLVGYIDFVSERDDLRRHISEIRVPVHVMASPLLTEGQSDPARVQLALSQVGYAGLTNLSFDYFGNAKHWLFWDDPTRFHERLEKFLNRIEGPMVKGAEVTTPPEPLRVRKKARPLAKAPR